MPRSNGKPPKYRHHKSSGRAYVVIDGSTIYLGRCDSAESHQKYHALIAEWFDNGRQLPPQAPPSPGGCGGGGRQKQVLVKHVTLAFMKHAPRRYVDPDGTPTREVGIYRSCARLLNNLYGDVPAVEFGPRKLQECIRWMARGGWTYTRKRRVRLGEPMPADPDELKVRVTAGPWTRKSLNSKLGRIRRMFRYAAGQEMIPASVYDALRTVDGLRRGEAGVIERPPVRPVAEPHVETALPFMPAPVAAMVRLQMATGMRPGEVLQMRGSDLDMSGDVWEYRPERHKNEWRGQERVVFLNQAAQEIIRPFLKIDINAPLFSPADAMAAMRQKRSEQRTTPLHYGNRPGSNVKRRPKVKPGDRYDVNTYRRAIQRACDVAFPPPEGLSGEELAAWRKVHRFASNQPRHTAATRIRREHGLEAAQVMLGHKHRSTTELYAEPDYAAARKIASGS